jgi:hypothetical protein
VIFFAFQAITGVILMATTVYLSLDINVARLLQEWVEQERIDQVKVMHRLIADNDKFRHDFGETTHALSIGSQVLSDAIYNAKHPNATPKTRGRYPISLFADICKSLTAR